MSQSKKGGILLSYVNIILSMVINIVLTPMMIIALSDDSYSLYKVIQSFAGPLMMFNMGVSTIVTRSIAKHRAANEDEKTQKENTFAMSLIVSSAMGAVIVLVGIAMMAAIPSIYGNNYSPELIIAAKEMFGILTVSTVVNILTETFRGCVVGHERFVFHYGASTLRYILKFAFIALLLKLGAGVVLVTLVDLINNIIVFLFYAYYALFKLKEKPKLHFFDKKELSEIFMFSIAILLQTIVNQVNNNVDIMILGALESNKEIITMYSSALTVYSVYNSMITVFSTVYFPQATKLVTRGCTKKEMTDFVIKPGRMQAMVAVAVIIGFAFIGKDFVSVWIGSKYIDAYYVILALIIPVTIPLVENVCISILDAQLKRMFRSVTLVIMALINVVFTLLGVYFFGFWGAAISTAISLIIGHGIIMNIYYQKVIGIEVFRMFREIFRGTLPAGLIAGLVCLPLSFIKLNHILWFLAKGAIFVTVYFVLLWFISFNKEEKAEIKKTLRISK